MKQEKYTIKDFNTDFPDDNACMEWLMKDRYPNGIICEKCKKLTKHHRVTKRACYACDYCGNQVYPMVGTIFEKSVTPLKLWFYAIFLMSATRCGISAKQIQRETGVTYKTAWRMFKQIRTLLCEDDSKKKYGEIEVDETYIGGRQRGAVGRGVGKTPVLGIVQRKGAVSAMQVKDCTIKTIYPLVRDHVDKSYSTVYTDEFTSYNKLTRQGYKHIRVNHAAREYVRGLAHTNTIEGFWSLLKRGINGVYHSVSDKYLQSYINEYGFRYNHRKDACPMFQTVLKRI